MAINVDYGPISAAVQLGTQAGRGQWWQQQTEDDDKFMSLMNDMQRTADARKATAMQNALGYADLQAHQQQTQAEMSLSNTRANWEHDYQQGELGVRNKEATTRNLNEQNEAAYRNGMLGVRNNANGIAQQRADTGQQRADTYQDHTDAYQQRVNQLEGQQKQSNADRQELSALQQQVKASHDEWAALQDPEISKRLGPSKRDDVPDTAYKAAVDKFNSAVALRDAKLQAMTQQQQPAADPMAGMKLLPKAGGAPGGGGPAPMPGAGPGMPAMPMQQQGSTPETKMQALTAAAAAVGVRPADVGRLPAPPQQSADQLKAMVMQQTSDPAQQRYLFYRLMIQAGMDPTKPPVQQQTMPPGQAQLPLRGQ